jgi:hypothetical protein
MSPLEVSTTTLSIKNLCVPRVKPTTLALRTVGGGVFFPNLSTTLIKMAL